MQLFHLIWPASIAANPVFSLNTITSTARGRCAEQFGYKTTSEDFCGVVPTPGQETVNNKDTSRTLDLRVDKFRAEIR